MFEDKLESEINTNDSDPFSFLNDTTIIENEKGIDEDGSQEELQGEPDDGEQGEVPDKNDGQESETITDEKDAETEPEEKDEIVKTQLNVEELVAQALQKMGVTQTQIQQPPTQQIQTQYTEEQLYLADATNEFNILREDYINQGWADDESLQAVIIPLAKKHARDEARLRAKENQRIAQQQFNVMSSKIESHPEKLMIEYAHQRYPSLTMEDALRLADDIKSFKEKSSTTVNPAKQALEREKKKSTNLVSQKSTKSKGEEHITSEERKIREAFGLL